MRALRSASGTRVAHRVHVQLHQRCVSPGAAFRRDALPQHRVSAPDRVHSGLATHPTYNPRQQRRRGRRSFNEGCSAPADLKALLLLHPLGLLSCERSCGAFALSLKLLLKHTRSLECLRLTPARSIGLSIDSCHVRVVLCVRKCMSKRFSTEDAAHVNQRTARTSLSSCARRPSRAFLFTAFSNAMRSCSRASASRAACAVSAAAFASASVAAARLRASARLFSRVSCARARRSRSTRNSSSSRVLHVSAASRAVRASDSACSSSASRDRAAAVRSASSPVDHKTLAGGSYTSGFGVRVR